MPRQILVYAYAVNQMRKIKSVMVKKSGIVAKHHKITEAVREEKGCERMREMVVVQMPRRL